MQCMPDSLVGKHYYKPTTQGKELNCKNRYEWILNWHKEHDKNIKKVPGFYWSKMKKNKK